MILGKIYEFVDKNRTFPFSYGRGAFIGSMRRKTKDEVGYKNMKEITWWDDLEKCRGRNKNGSRCKNYCSPPFEINKGELLIPTTCFQHSSQEKNSKKEEKCYKKIKNQ